MHLTKTTSRFRLTGLEHLVYSYCSLKDGNRAAHLSLFLYFDHREGEARVVAAMGAAWLGSQSKEWHSVLKEARFDIE
jgi:hypothetical protein